MLLLTDWPIVSPFSYNPFNNQKLQKTMKQKEFMSQLNLRRVMSKKT